MKGSERGEKEQNYEILKDGRIATCKHKKGRKVEDGEEDKEE